MERWGKTRRKGDHETFDGGFLPSTTLLWQSKLYGTWKWEVDMPYILCTEGLFHIFDIAVPPDHLISKEQFFHIIHPEFQDFFKEQIKVAQQSGETAFEYRIVTSKGQDKILNGFMALVPDKKGSFIVGTCLDVTQLNKQPGKNDAVIYSHEHTESLAKMASWQWTPVKNKLTLSASFFKLLDINPDEFDVTYQNLLSLIHIEDRHKLPPTFSVEIVDDKASSVEIRMFKDSGDVIHIKSIHQLSTNERGDVVVAGTLQDISEEVALRRELEEKKLFAEMLFDRSIDLISAYDKNGRVIAWNKTCEVRYGIKKEYALGKDVLGLYPSLANDPWVEDLTSALAGQFIFRTNQTSGSLDGYFDYYLLPLITDDGEILGALSISHDLTEMQNVAKRLDELNHSLEEKNEELERSNSELASFSYIASHDLQEPLRKIQTFSQRIIQTETQSLSAQGRDYLRRMEAAAKRMQTLIEDLLTFSRTNTTLKNLEEVDLNKLADDVQIVLKEAIEEKNAIIEVSRLPIAKVIPFQFRQLLENLLSNALKYSKNSIRPHIKISAQTLAGIEINLHGINANKNYVQLIVSDNGIGFEQQYAEKIFELFQRLHGKHEYPGTGLGLSICKKIIQNHHGVILATGQPGNGATFTIYLPE